MWGHERVQVVVQGMLRTGVKRLFVTERGQWRELTPVCVLDFYVHESCQVRPSNVPAATHPLCGVAPLSFQVSPRACLPRVVMNLARSQLHHS